MLKIRPKILSIAPVTFSLLLFVSGKTTAEPVRDPLSGLVGQDILQQEASQFSDVSPEDWAFPALNNLVQPNHCLNSTAFGYRARLNFDSSFTGRDRLRTRLQAGNLQNLPPVGTETTNTETQDDNEPLPLEYRARLSFDSSFTGRDRLRTRLQAGNLQNLPPVGTETTNTETQDDNEPLPLEYRARLNFDNSFTGRDRLRTRLQARNLQNLPQLGTETTNTGSLTPEAPNVETQQTTCRLR